MQIDTAFVLAAGLGTRMHSGLPKVMHLLGGRPMVHYPVARAVEIGASRVVVVVGYKGDMVEGYLREAFPDAGLVFARQDPPRGTADAVLTGLGILDVPPAGALILYGDVPNVTPEVLSTLGQRVEERKAAVGVLTMRPPDLTGYGRIVREGEDVLRITEEKDASPDVLAIDEVNSGLYLMEGEVLLMLIDRVGCENVKGEFYLTDLIELAAGQGRSVEGVEVPFDQVAGVNTRADLADAAAVWRGRKNRQLMRNGVSMEDPLSTYVDDTVEIAPDVALEPGVVLRGKTRVCTGTVIMAGAHVTDSTIGPGVLVRPYTVMEEVVLEEGVKVGPFARLRPKTILRAGSSVGNFVEVKKTDFGKGSKAGHLTYLGDTVVGDGVNVGAGTITCNYDGVNKHLTEIDDGAFIGSGSQLIAPVRVGKQAYIGAGSTVSKDVPDGALGLSRARQRNMDGYALKLREQALAQKLKKK